jgi:hypothetical protein
MKSRIQIVGKSVSRVKREFVLCERTLALLAPATLDSNLLNSAHARRMWQASIEFVRWPKKKVSPGWARVIDQAGPHSTVTCEP